MPRTIAPTLDNSAVDVVDALTPRTIACAILLGSIVCLANMYFGLQAGMVNAMPMQSALLGFALFRSIQHRLSKPLSPSETTLIEIIAGAFGLSPFTSGFTSFIPALEFLTTSEENGPTRFSFAKLLLWSIATCGPGIITGAPFRKLFLLHERLHYPSATATGILIGVLFGKEEIIARANLSKTVVSQPESWKANPDRESLEIEIRNDVGPAEPDLSSDDPSQRPAEDDNGPAIKVLLLSLAASVLFSFVSYFVPILRRVPIFGLTAATDWLWAFDLSPAYIGYGIIIGPSVSAYIVLGAVIGWGILSPVAKHNGWARGPINDWDTDSRGWILWVGMGLTLGDTIVGLGWITMKPLLLWSRHALEARLRPQNRTPIHEPVEQVPLLYDSPDTYPENDEAGTKMDGGWPSTSLAMTALML